MNIMGSNLTTNMSTEVQRTYQPQAVQSAAQTRRTDKTDAVRTEKADAVRRFDSVSIENGRHASFELELRGRLKQEIRAAMSSGQVAALSDEVRGGAYTPDPAAIARKLLLMESVV